MPFGAIGVKRVGVRKRGNHRKFMNRRVHDGCQRPATLGATLVGNGGQTISVSCLAKHRRGTAQPSLDESVEAGAVHCARIRHRGQAHTPQVGKGTRRRGATRYLCRGRSGPTNDKRIVPDRVGAVYFCTRDRNASDDRV